MFKQSSILKRKLVHVSLVLLAFSFVVITSANNVSAQRRNLGRTITSGDTNGLFLVNAGVDIDQCGNGGVTRPLIRCRDGWQNGNLNENGSHYVEGQFVPYRNIFENLTSGASYTVRIEYDTTQNGKHAIDYLGTYTFTESVDNDPCVGRTIGSNLCNLLTPSTIGILNDPNVLKGFDGISGTADDITPIAGVFTMFGGTLTGVSVPFLTSGDYSGSSKTAVDVTFTANAGTAVLAWGGHISTRLDWGILNSAVNITGAPYHMRNLSLVGPNAGNLGNQDRSLSAAAVYFPSVLRIVKSVSTFDGTGSSTTPFTFNTINATPASFVLTDNIAGPGGAEQVITFTTAPVGAVQVNEVPASGWSFNGFTNCVISGGGNLNVGTITQTAATATVSFNLEEANLATCTFNNLLAAPTAARATVSGQVRTSAGMGIRGAVVSITNASTGETFTALTNSFGNYSIGGLEVQNLYTISVTNKRYTFSNGSQWFVLSDDLAGITFTSDQ